MEIYVLEKPFAEVYSAFIRSFSNYRRHYTTAVEYSKTEYEVTSMQQYFCILILTEGMKERF